MIRIVKSLVVPAVLVSDGLAATQSDCQLYNATPTTYDKGTAKLVIRKEIYGHETVKAQLKADQHEKCCFCEADFTANGYGDVEHFRPKAGYRLTIRGKLNRPGYYWLAYDWDNLFFSCQICNQQFKKNYFPLIDETQRATNHNEDYMVEAPILIHPALDEPTDYITFNRHVPAPVNNSNRGKLTISGLGLDRNKLNQVREAYLQNVRNNLTFAEVDLESLTEDEQGELGRIFHMPWQTLESIILTAKEFIKVAATDQEPFAAMVRANFPDLV